MPYTYITLAQMMALLAARMQDPAMRFYQEGHLRSACLESLRTWQAMSTVARGRFTFNLTSGTGFYDIGDSSVVATTLVPRTLTDQSLVNDLQYALMEPANDWSLGSTWTGTAQFTMADLVNALQRRRDQFLLETASVLTYSEPASGSPPNGRVPLSENVIDVRRAAWKDTSNVFSTLWRSDERQLNSLLVGWSVNTGTPQVFSTIVVPPITLQLGPVQAAGGTLSLVTVNAGAALNVAAGIALGIPDDFAWALKYGALADLLSKDGEARDPARAAHCEQRYAEGVMLARIYQSVLNLEVNGAQAPLVSLQSLDSLNPGWQTIATNSGTPVLGAMAGLNLIAFSPVPNAADSITIDCVRNAPVPASDGADVQLDKGQLEGVLDYACYVARFKEAGAEFEMTWPLAQNLLKLAQGHNDRLRAQAQQQEALADSARKERQRRPYYGEDAVQVA